MPFLFELLFSDGGGMTLEFCALADDGRACALEYNAVARDRTNSPPGAGLAVHVRGAGRRLAGVRLYGDANPPSSEDARNGVFARPQDRGVRVSSRTNMRRRSP